MTESPDSAAARTVSTEVESTSSPSFGAGHLAVILALASALALSPAVPLSALLEAGTYLAPLALFLGVLSTAGAGPHDG